MYLPPTPNTKSKGTQSSHVEEFHFPSKDNLKFTTIQSAFHSISYFGSDLQKKLSPNKITLRVKSSWQESLK